MAYHPSRTMSRKTMGSTNPPNIIISWSYGNHTCLRHLASQHHHARHIQRRHHHSSRRSESTWRGRPTHIHSRSRDAFNPVRRRDGNVPWRRTGFRHHDDRQMVKRCLHEIHQETNRTIHFRCLVTNAYYATLPTCSKPTTWQLEYDRIWRVGRLHDWQRKWRRHHSYSRPGIGLGDDHILIIPVTAQSLCVTFIFHVESPTWNYPK